MPLFFKRLLLTIKKSKKKKGTTNPKVGEDLAPTEQPLIEILGTEDFPSEVPNTATYGQLLAGVNWIIPGVPDSAALNKAQIEAIAKMMEKKSDRKYKWGAGACCTCTW